MLWLNFLHLYQKANADAYVIKEATELSYRRLLKALEKNPRSKFTLNISGCLFLRWDELNYFEIIKKIRILAAKKQIEITGTAAYHPLLPLIPAREAAKQIKENETILKKYLEIKPAGFFFPEMAYSAKAAKIVKSLGYQWTILDEVAVAGKLNRTDCGQIYLEENGLKVILRQRKLSESYVPEAIAGLLKKEEKPALAITATDGELYGLRHTDPTGKLEKLLKERSLKTLTISAYLQKQQESRKIKLLPSAWTSSEEEVKKGLPFRLWSDKKNLIQKKLWELARLALWSSEKYRGDKNYDWARWHLARGLASCTFWWASGKDFREIYGPVSWSPDEIERGAEELIRSIRSLDNPRARLLKIKGEKLYISIKKLVWKKHWTYYWKISV